MCIGVAMNVGSSGATIITAQGSSCSNNNGIFISVHQRALCGCLSCRQTTVRMMLMLTVNKERRSHLHYSHIDLPPAGLPAEPADFQ